MNHPRFIDPITLAIPNLPEALRGLKVLHITDLHIRRHRAVYEQLIATITRIDHDILALTGDVMDDEGHEPVAFETATRLVNAARPRIGAFGVHGNHDTHDLRRRLEHLSVRWLHNRAFVHPSLPLSILGVECDVPERNAPRGDLLAALLSEQRERPNFRGFRLLLAHIPNWLPAASDGSVDLMLSGHTHAGQVRLPGLDPLYNATPGWPHALSGGIYRGGPTTAVISRGVGESYMDGLRLFCTRQVPLIMLERAETAATEIDRGITCLRRW